MLLLYSFMICAVTDYPAASVSSEKALDYLNSAIAAREQTSSGRFELTVRLYGADRSVHSIWKLAARADGDRYRVDVVDTTLPIYGRQGPLVAEPLETRVWDGKGAVLRRSFNTSSFRYMEEEHPPLITDTFFNPCFLGLPATYGPQVNVETAFLKGYSIVEAIESAAGLINITLQAPDEGGRSISIKFTLDPQKSFAVTEYNIKTRHVYKDEGDRISGYEAKASSDLVLVDGRWFPRIVRYDQYHDGSLQWGREITVDKVDLVTPVPGSCFTWEGIGIAPYQTIISAIPGRPSFDYVAASVSSRNVEDPQRGKR